MSEAELTYAKVRGARCDARCGMTEADCMKLRPSQGPSRKFETETRQAVRKTSTLCTNNNPTK